MRSHMAFRLSGGIGDFMVMLGRIAALLKREASGRDAIVVIDDPCDEDYARIAKDARFISSVHEVPVECFPDFLLWGANSHHYGKRTEYVDEFLASLDADVFDWGNELDRGRMWFDSALPRASLSLEDFGWPARDGGIICMQPVSVWSKGENSLWPEWADAARHLVESGFEIEIIGGDHDDAVIRETGGEVLSLPGVHNLAGRLSLKESVSRVVSSEAVMGIESWAALVAAEFGVSSWMRRREGPHAIIPAWEEMGLIVNRDWLGFIGGLQ